MSPKFGNPGDLSSQSQQKITYIQQMLGQLAVVARSEKQDMLSYLIDMAYEEARDVLKRLG